MSSERTRDDIIGKKFGRLKVIKENRKLNDKARRFDCECECGNLINTRYSRLKNGEKLSCGCIELEIKEKEDKAYIGLKQDMLTVKEVKRENGRVNIHCMCDCGNYIVYTKEYWHRKHFKSCGCINSKKQRERQLKHGMSNTLTYNTYTGMLGRCNDPGNSSYKYYGARGIKVCDKWLESFNNFYEDMGDRPDGYTLDRIDVNGNYEPSNCRWADNTTQSINQRCKSRKTKYKNIDEFKSGKGTRYRASVSRKGLIRRCTPLI